MLSKRLSLVLIMFLFQCSSKKQDLRKICFVNDDSMVILNGNVKQITEAPVDDEYSTNPGQDYSVVDINKKGDVTKIVNGFHGGIFKTYYTTSNGTDGKRFETKGYIKQHDFIGIIPKRFLHRKPIDTGEQLFSMWKYNNLNQIVNCVVSPNKPDADSSIYKYNNEGELIELDNYPYSQKSMDVTKYKYDDNSNLIELDKFHGNELLTRVTYEYKIFDSEDNWIDLTAHFDYSSFNEKRTFKIHREITYY